MDATQCIHEILKFNFIGECFGILLSKWLGYSIILGSIITKLPQVMNMIKDPKLSTQLDENTLYLDILAFWTVLVYNVNQGYPFSVYGENVFVLIQNLIIFLIFVKNIGVSFKRLGFLILLSAVSVFIFTSDLMVEEYWNLIIASSIPINLVSKILTIIFIYKNKTAGPLSKFTFILNAGGNSARVFTILQEAFDISLLINSGSSLLTNLIIIAQITYYGSSNKEVKDVKEKTN